MENMDRMWNENRRDSRVVSEACIMCTFACGCDTTSHAMYEAVPSGSVVLLLHRSLPLRGRISKMIDSTRSPTEGLSRKRRSSQLSDLMLFALVVCPLVSFVNERAFCDAHKDARVSDASSQSIAWPVITPLTGFLGISLGNKSYDHTLRSLSAISRRPCARTALQCVSARAVRQETAGIRCGKTRVPTAGLSYLRCPSVDRCGIRPVRGGPCEAIGILRSTNCGKLRAS